MAHYSSTLAWKIPWMEEPGRLQSMGSLSRTWLSNFTFTFHFHALEKAMATHSSVLAWRIPGTVEPGELLSMGSHRVGHDWSDLAAAAEEGSPWPVIHTHQVFSLFNLKWEEMRDTDNFPSQWDKVSFAWKLREERPSSSWPHLSSMKLVSIFARTEEKEEVDWGSLFLLRC